MKTLILFLLPFQIAAQCPTHTATTGYDTFQYCGGTVEGFDTTTLCDVQYNYATVAFSTSGVAPVQIEVTSAMNYTWNPNGANVYAHLWIFNECHVDPVWTTTGGACATGTGEGGYPSQNYMAWVDLPAGDYVLLFGYVGSPLGGAQSMTGCVEVTIGYPTVLELLPSSGRGGGADPEYVPRYTKVIVEGRGVFIKDGHTGELYDVLTRKVKASR